MLSDSRLRQCSGSRQWKRNFFAANDARHFARGKDNRAERRGIGSASQGAGGGGGAQTEDKASPLTTGRSTRPARKRGTASSAGRRGAAAR